MLSPDEIYRSAAPIQPLLDKLELFIIGDMVSRIMARLQRGEDLTLTATDVWQMEVLKESDGHYEKVLQAVKSFTKATQPMIQKIFEEAGIRSWEEENETYRIAGKEITSLKKSQRMLDILRDSILRTNGTVHNLTRTTAAQSQKKLIEILDNAHFRVVTGAQSLTAAVSEAIDEAGKTQSKVIYTNADGSLRHIDSVETAVMRAVRTGTAQCCSNITIQRMIDGDWDVVIVNSHLGARYGDGGHNPSNHSWWQGKFYSLGGKTDGLLPFYETTGYGTGEGLCGWNCRHSPRPGILGHDPYRKFDSEENKKAYDISQKQRAMERRICADRKKAVAYRTASEQGSDKELTDSLKAKYDKARKMIKKHTDEYLDFCKANDLKPQYDRTAAARK